MPIISLFAVDEKHKRSFATIIPKISHIDKISGEETLYFTVEKLDDNTLLRLTNYLVMYGSESTNYFVKYGLISLKTTVLREI
jgi:hypothetical protein